MCTTETYSGELQLILKQLRGRNHRLFHDTEEVAQYFQSRRNEEELAQLLHQMADKLQEAEKIALRAIALLEEKEATERERVTPTITRFP
ncbi:hypothetical protein [Heliorestis convoluta]|uniref:Uncharacterized protein n=1 Tax=Heliorestis convoluta TaxID=356322 RepID=A0A5Q2N885_9FIRM|nr:hypothetical protein [Heliorestis convoluta]QGG48460.1 hypothetical protein FTV88_2362 [Heliorestis convoluta]